MKTGGKGVASALLLLSAVFALSSGLPVKYDQRQDGDFNVHAHLENFIIVFIPSSSSSFSIADIFRSHKNNQQQHGTKHAGVANNSGKYVPPSTAVKSSSPDFPAGKSPYKVDLDVKPEGQISKVHKELDNGKTSGAATEEVVIAHSPSVVASTTAAKTESKSTEPTPTATTESSNDIPSTEKSSETEKKEEIKFSVDKVDKFEVEKGDSSIKDERLTEKKEEVDSKKETPSENEDTKVSKLEKVEVIQEKMEDTPQKEKVDTEKKDEKLEEEKKEENVGEKKEEADKKEDIPTIESMPGKAQKSPKSIDFVVEVPEVPVSKNTKEHDESIPVIDFVPSIKLTKSSKFPSFRHEVSVSHKTDSSEELSHKLTLLKSGLSECGPDQRRDAQGLCQQIKRQRSGQYFSTDSRLAALKFGLSPAVD